MHTDVDVAGTGFTVLDRIYSNNQKSSESLGGSCGNVLVSLAMLSRKVMPVLCLGQDEVGTSLIKEFAAAGADTRFISQRLGVASPIVAQKLDITSGQHCFSFVCPETDKALPRYLSISEADVAEARPALNACSIFYTDRLTDAILTAMATAVDAGAHVYFEPSKIEDEELFQRALGLTSLLKYSSDRLSERLAGSNLKPGAISVVTHGAHGLEVRQDNDTTWCAAIPAITVRDTCGSGDMVTVGIIDWILGNQINLDNQLQLDALIGGVVAGQRLAAANCGYTGARGLFKRYGADIARLILDGAAGNMLSQYDLFEAENDI